MAKRSDFAQKLLDDLRLRKEKMGMATAGQRSAQAPSTDAYGNSRWAFRGSGEATSSRFSNKNIPNTEVTKMGTRHHRAPSFEGASQDIVPVGRTRSKEQSIDVSMALALALSNTGKLQNIEFFSNATVGKKLILHCGSPNFREMHGNMMRTSDQFPFLSPLQIGEISKGVQQLNMILKACSNGVIFSRDSIDIGRELLKGAIDLEESLRMLVSLQDASDYMAGSQGKQIKLLKGKEDESTSKEVNNRKLMRPKFSFDRSSKHSHHHVREGSNSDLIEQKQRALSYPEILKNPKSNSNKSSSNTSLQFNYHRQSLSSGPGSRHDAQILGHANEISHSKELRSFSKDGSCSNSTGIKHSGSKGSSVCEKVRIPNVVAKLMGLEELPLAMPEAKKIEVQNVPNPMQVKGSSKKNTDAEISIKEANQMTTDAEISKKEVNQMTCSAPKMKGQNVVTVEKGTAKTKAVNNLELAHSKVNKNMKELTNPEQKFCASSEVHQSSISKEMDMASMDCCKEFKVAKKAATEGGEKVSTMQQIQEEKIEQGPIRKPTLEHGTQNTTSLLHGNSDDAVSKHEEAQKNQDVVPKQQRNKQEVHPIVPQQQSAVHRLKTKHTVHKNGEKIEHNKRNKLQYIVAKKKEVKLKNAEISPSGMKTQVSSSISTTTVTRSLLNSSDTEQPKEYPKSNHIEQKKSQNKKSAYLEVDRKSENEISGKKRPLKVVVKTEKEKAIPLIPAPAIKNPVPNPSAQKVDVTKLMRDRNENRGILIEESRRVKTTEMKVQNLKQKNSFLHELEHRWKERTGKAEAIVSSHSMKSEHHSQQMIAPTNRLCSSDEREISGLTDQIITAETTVEAQQEEDENPMRSRDTTITESAALQQPEIYVKEDLELQPLLEENKPEGLAARRQLSNCNSLGGQNIATSEVHGKGLRTKDEYTLKQILMNSRHFLNTAQALFKIKIPIGILQASESICQYKGDKLVVDTGYELMRRKCKREEDLFSKKIPFAPGKVRCLDDLVKELKNDLRSLEMPSKTEDANNNIAECLQKMIERDIQNRNPDVNCMWDICWNSMAFANIEKEEIIRDVEKHVLNGLINDLARDLISVGISI